MIWYIVITIKSKLTADTTDEVGVITKKGTTNIINNGLKAIGSQSGPPHKVTHTRISSNGQKFIVELETEKKPTKQLFLDAISIAGAKTGLAMKIFAGKDWEEKRKNCVQYLIDNKADWEGVISAANKRKK